MSRDQRWPSVSAVHESGSRETGGGVAYPRADRVAALRRNIVDLLAASEPRDPDLARLANRAIEDLIDLEKAQAASAESARVLFDRLSAAERGGVESFERFVSESADRRRAAGSAEGLTPLQSRMVAEGEIVEKATAVD
ncbi:hypothetical protein [Prosthecomicrobium hirschii]|uniref:hypothetical protein n=1 Tax=Prosthecodimorpha hirschii TaxID=665126 RepID=UPI002220CC78|nr:hypothetical protein [Prosthecomicrobium hirschii]MCW1840229.1 hypothetical protein [Prosthecomicrobium hirschii]